MTYNLREWAVDNVAPASAPVTLTDEQIREGVKCGALDLVRLNSGLALAFADIKTVHDQDDFLKGAAFLSVDADNHSLGFDLNEVEDSSDVAVTFATVVNGPIRAAVQGANSNTLLISFLLNLVDFNDLTQAQADIILGKLDFSNLTAAQTAAMFGNVEFKKKLCELINLHWKDIAGDLHFANGCDANGDPTFAP